MPNPVRGPVAVLALLAAHAAAPGSVAAQPLPELTLAPEVTVSGLSSGAYMAGQLHVAFSQSISGAAVIAGGPYACAGGSVLTALNRCMATRTGGPDAADLLAQAQTFAAQGRIDDLAGLAGDRVWLFSGTRDETVARPVMDAARDFYLAAGVAAGDLAYVSDVPAGHAFLAEGAPNACGVTEPDFINDCGVDMAGDLLTWLLGDLAPPVSPDPAHLTAFDQSEFLPDPETHGMNATGFVYVPEACAAGEACRLHVAFHGCRQTPDDLGDLYARAAGYNRWAEANRIVVLYPQAKAIPTPLTRPLGGNPRGCWDWWGYDDPDHALRSGRQTAAVAAMAARLGAPLAPENPTPGPTSCTVHEGPNWSHWLEERATWCGFYSICTATSGERLGPVWSGSTIYESPPGTFAAQPCAP